MNKKCIFCGVNTIQEESKQIFSNPVNIIIYLKNDDPNSNFCLNYPPTISLDNKLLNMQNTSGNANGNIEQFYLKSVVQQNIQNGKKSYGCCFQYNQLWYMANGYNCMQTIDSPYKFNFGNVLMLFYSSQIQ